MWKAASDIGKSDLPEEAQDELANELALGARQIAQEAAGQLIGELPPWRPEHRAGAGGLADGDGNLAAGDAVDAIKDYEDAVREWGQRRPAGGGGRGGDLPVRRHPRHRRGARRGGSRETVFGPRIDEALYADDATWGEQYCH